ncbi:MarR family winged helix-turn-helix transcriptional regulator [Priestia megaterium]|jgi:MarR family transcriptional regulator, organic hydroperoxide resistance regulator|uniref:MarR family winged helix-turn-helix transcriptional regulator n=1 Tax=Priestia TaxID=2800373 RepID=UPI0005C5BC5E|nr:MULTISPECIES: MarR family transcriptional regulator [Priestia]KWU68605.1 MarR family transcriptional regulator [Priestia megaterium]MBX9995364.1 MarR family transcriptional regulator [Priestia aryabhattai]MCF8887990.1 MarR family transcriptional regulator [Priestia megaterium]MCP1450236.1 DNA-binding MarR family transcriptional regulator [Priestia megaterium]MEB2265505.1 MarR family transcriptional regulator [Priestia megaterium]
MDQQLIDKLEKLDQVKTSLFELKRKLLEDKISEQPYNLTITKFLILKFIGVSSKRMVAEISSNLKLTSGATTILLNQLEADALIKRVRDQKDRRIVWISLTEAGETLVNYVIEQRNLFWQDMLFALTPEEQDEYLRMLEKMEKRIRQTVDR